MSRNDTGKKKIKLTHQELITLQKHFKSIQKITTDRAFLCLNKELEIKDYIDRFNKKFSMLNTQLEEIKEQQKDFISIITEKYGKDNSFNIETGLVLPIEST
jgi:hypothetical protein